MKRTSLGVNYDEDWSNLVISRTNYKDGLKWRVSISKNNEWFFGYNESLRIAMEEAEANADEGKTGSIRQLEDLF